MSKSNKVENKITVKINVADDEISVVYENKKKGKKIKKYEPKILDKNYSSRIF